VNQPIQIAFKGVNSCKIKFCMFGAKNNDAFLISSIDKTNKYNNPINFNHFFINIEIKRIFKDWDLFYFMKIIKDFEENYNIDFNKIINKINNKNYKLVLLQFPDGLKQYSMSIVDFLKSKCKNIEFLIWFGDCFGACDTPILGSEIKVDLVIQFGHNSLMPNI
jgi:2-(3-amino-3-carboxypropyl)histidine synthase